MPKVKDWVSAARLRTLPLAFSSIITGAALAVERDYFDPAVFALCLLTTLCLQVLSNYANDLGDHLKGTDDSSRVGPTRAIQGGAITARAMKHAVIVMSIASLLSGIALLYQSGLRFDMTGLIFFGLGLVAIAAAIKYTAGSNPYGYAGLGDISVFLFFGLLGVLGSSFLHGLEMPFSRDVFAASAIGFCSAAVLNLNNMRDAIPDKAAGKTTMAVRLGPRPSRLYHAILLSLGSMSALLYIYYTYSRPIDFLPMIVLIVFIVHILKVFRTKEDAQFDPELKKIALTTFFMSVLLFLTTRF